jgi:uncharacterized protein involved in outer membrane biogenesis
MKALKIVGAIVVVLVLGAVAFAMTFDIAKYKGVIQDQAKAATGRDVTIGDIRLGLSLTPTVVLTDVSIGNAPWGSRPQMVGVKSLEVKAELLPLLSRRVSVSKIVLDGADVLLEVNRQGQANWQFAPPEAAKGGGASGGSQTALSVSAIDVSNLMLALKDAKAGNDVDVAVKSASLRIDGPVQEMNVSSLKVDDATVTRRAGQDDLKVAVGKVALESQGPIAGLGFKKIEAADIKVSGRNAGKPVNVEVSKIALDEKGALDLEAKYDGGDIRAKGTVAAAAALKSGQKAVPMKLALEGLGLKGEIDLTVNAAATPPAAKGTIVIPEIDLAKFAPTDAKAGAKGKAAPANAGPMFSSDPLPWDSLHAVDADVKVSIGTVKLSGGESVANVSLPIKLDKGHLVLNDASVDLAGGKVVADLDANAGTKTVAVKGALKAMTAEALAKTYKVTDLITGGPLDLAVDLRGTGASPKAIAASLSGSAIGGMGESKIRNDALNIIGADVIMQVLSAINPMGNKDPYTVARCAAVNMQFAGGVGNTQNGIAMVTDKMQLVASGKVDLGQERVDMVVKPTATGGLGIGLGKLVSAVKVNGPIRSPNIGLDAGGTAKAMGGLAAAFATGGASLLAQGAADRAGAASGGDVCAAARTWNKR